MSETTQENHGSGLLYFMPAWIFEHKELSQTEKMVYALLSGLAHGNEHKTCFPSDKYIAKRIGIRETGANEAVASLTKVGAISKVTVPHETNAFKKKRIITVYLWPQKMFTNSGKPEPRQSEKPEVADSGKPEGSNKVYRNKASLSKEREETPAKAVDPPAKFIEFEKYPRVTKMTMEGYDALIVTYGKEKVEQYLEELNDYPDINKKRFNGYSNHATVIKTWIKRDEKKPFQPKSSERSINIELTNKIKEANIHLFQKGEIEIRSSSLVFKRGNYYGEISFDEKGFKEKVISELVKARGNLWYKGN